MASDNERDLYFRHLCNFSLCNYKEGTGNLFVIYKKVTNELLRSSIVTVWGVRIGREEASR